MLTRIGLIAGLAAAGLGLAVPGVSLAAEVLVLGNPGQDAERAFADAFHAASALKTSGGAVDMERDLDADPMATAVARISGADEVVIYIAGALKVESGETFLVTRSGTDPRLTLSAIIASLAAEGTTQARLLIENCAGLSGTAAAFVPEKFDDAPLALTVTASATPSGQCPAASARLTDALAAAGQGAEPQGLDAVLAAFPSWGAGDAAADVNLGGAPAEPDPAPVTAGAGGDGGVTDLGGDGDLIIVTAAPVTATQVRPTATAAPSVQSGAASPGRTGEITVFTAPPLSQQASLPVAEGLPQPSIIVGLLDPPVTEASFNTVPDDPGDVASSELTFDSFDARTALRDSDPELFETLLASGAFDPPDGQVERALQTELARMKCYTSTVDGIWGNGSRASVTRYFAQVQDKLVEFGDNTITVVPSNTNPTVSLYRFVIQNDNVTCPAPVATTSRPSSGTTTRPSGSTTTSPAPAPAPAPAPPPSGTIQPGALSGVFR